jgi:hypothetical protein
MGTILSSKTFFLPKSGCAPFGDVHNWLTNIGNRSEDCLLTIKLETVGKGRQKRKSAVTELSELARNAALDYKGPWEQGEYKFFFLGGKFFWREKEVYLTSSEKLFLFRWLVLGDEVDKSQWYYLRNMRSRLGKDFLADIQKESE